MAKAKEKVVNKSKKLKPPKYEKTKGLKNKPDGLMLDYVSGSVIPTMRLNTNKFPDIQDWNMQDLSDLLKYTQSKTQGYFTLSSLYNAFQEQKDGNMLNHYNRIGFNSTYADSGGLQGIRRGIEMSDDIKNGVYKNQAEYSDFAFTFDISPKRGISALKDKHKGRFTEDFTVYVKSLVEPAAREGAANIKKQIEMFKELGAKTKILPILHGYDSESFATCADIIMNECGDTTGYVEGLAMASLSVHADNKVGIMKMFDFVAKTMNDKNIDLKHKEHIHLLGVGLTQRTLPLMMMVKKGLIPESMKRLSFDSTAVTKSYHNGRVYRNTEEFKNPGDYNPVLGFGQGPNVQQFYSNIYNLFQGYPGLLFDSVEDLIRHSQNNGDRRVPSEQMEEHGDLFRRKYLQQMRLYQMYNLHCYLTTMEGYFDDSLNFRDLFHYSDAILHMYETFEHNVHTLDDVHEVCDYFYNDQNVNLRIIECANMDEFEKLKNNYTQDIVTHGDILF